MTNYYYGIASGSSGNCGLLVIGDSRILFDLGVSVRRLKQVLATLDLKIEDLDAVLLTHEHIDHIKGLSTFAKHYTVPVYASEGTAAAILEKHPHAEGALQTFPGGAELQLGDACVQSFLTPHDAAESVGYVVEQENVRFGYATDIGFVPGSIRRALTGCGTVVLEANHDPEMLRTGPYPYTLKARVGGPRGHLSNPDCAELATALVETGTTQLILSHLSEQNNMPSMARMEVEAALHAQGLSCQLVVAPRDAMTVPVKLEEKERMECCPSA